MTPDVLARKIAEFNDRDDDAPLAAWTFGALVKIGSVLAKPFVGSDYWAIWAGVVATGVIALGSFVLFFGGPLE
jgi:hypothetical protein